MLVLSSGIVSAETQTLDDPENDVIRIQGTPPSGTLTEHISDQPNVDIIQVSCVIEGSKLTLKLEVASDGTIIQTDSAYYYYAVANTSDHSIYYIMIAYGEGAIAMGAGPGGTPSVPGVQISENSMQAQFDLLADSTIVNVAGYTSYKVSDSDVYQDFAPDRNNNQTSGNNNNNNNTNNNNNQPAAKTPGFEAIAVIAAIGVAFILLKRRK